MGGRGESCGHWSQAGTWDPHLLEAHEFSVVKDQKDTEDEEPGNDVEHKAEEGHPGGPRLSPSLPQHWTSGYSLPVPHHQLRKDENQAGQWSPSP